jgi:ribosomal protein S18 acetylase RimI-like enzyme
MAHSSPEGIILGKGSTLVKMEVSVNEETLEYGLLQHIKMCLECNNESQAIRLLEKYGFEKQEERYSEEEVMDMFHNLSMHLPLHYEFLVKEQFKKK